jgi:sterol desaturase/sphingolipid hydroxylase (fatty acid hydroxylase superfamily)
MQIVAVAIPLFFLCIGVELALARRRGVAVYRFNDAVTDLSAGIFQQATLVFLGLFLYVGYARLYAHTLFTLPTWAQWVFAFFAVDFLFYWWHRMSHEHNLLWAAHVIHHSSEDYNLAVALRQGLFSRWTEIPFFLPLAFLGVPPLVYAITYSLNELYQFWIHTRLVGKPGWIGKILNLPSHHRVHHAINPQYLDKNYGGVLIVWDRLFGTYADESEEPVYGITKRLGSFDGVWAQLHYVIELCAMTLRAPGIDKLRVWWKSPAWAPAWMSKTPRSGDKYDPPVSSRRKIYLGVQIALTSAAMFSLMMWFDRMPRPLAIALAALVVAGVITVGGLVEKKRWAVPAETLRVAAALAVAVYFR